MNLSLLLFVLVLSASVLAGPCGDVLTHNGFSDLSPSEDFTVEWNGFGDSVILYEWAVFSEDRASSFDFSIPCQRQFRAVPDVQPWKKLSSKQLSISSNQLNLNVGSTYYSGLRVTFSNGEQRVALSNSIRVTEAETSSQKVERIHKEEGLRNPLSFHISESGKSSRSLSETCALDVVSCDATVSQRLNSLYGKPLYQKVDTPFGSINAFPARPGYSAEDVIESRNVGSGIFFAFLAIPAIILLCLFCCCLLLILLLALLAGKKIADSDGISMPGGGGSSSSGRSGSSKGKKSDSGIMFGDDVEEGKDYGRRGNTKTDSTSTNTFVEFPDVQAGPRLSISHDSPPVLEEEASVRPGRPAHPIMSSASSSFRDYRN